MNQELELATKINVNADENQAVNTETILNTNTVQVFDNKNQAVNLRFNKDYKLTHKQRKVFQKQMYGGAGMRFEGKEITFDFPEKFIENMENQKEVLIAVYWQTEEYWRTSGTMGKFWDSRPAELLSIELFDHMYEQVEKLDPLSMKKLKEKAEKEAKNDE